MSLFEPHTDIIRKGGRQTHYGHKINLTTGRSALVLDVVVEDGNPADSERCVNTGANLPTSAGVKFPTAGVAMRSVVSR